MKSSLFSIRMFLAASLLAVALFGLSPLAARAQVNFTATPPGKEKPLPNVTGGAPAK